jgi:phage-related protein
LKLITIFTAIGALAGLVIYAIIRLVKMMARAIRRVLRLGQQTQEVKEDFKELRAAVRSAFLPLLQLAMPALQAIARILTRIFTFIGSIVGAFFGMTEIIQSTGDALDDASGSAADLADNSEDAEKAAEGALAAFDEIDVLEMEQPEEPSPGGGGGGAGLEGFTMVPISEKILQFVQDIKDFFAPLWEPLRNLWHAIRGLGEAIWNALKPLFGELADSGILEFLRDLAINGIEWLTEKIIQLTDWINNNQEAFQKIMIVLAAVALAFALVAFPVLAVIAAIGALIFVIATLVNNWDKVKDAAKYAWDGIVNIWQSAGNWFKTKVWDPIKNSALNVINSISEFFSNLWTDITDWAANAINSIIEFFTNLWTDITDGAAGAINDIGDAIESVFSSVGDFLKRIMNDIIDIINGLIRGVVDGLNAIIGVLNGISIDIPKWVPVYGGKTFGINIEPLTAPQIPHLAQGGVIPPNSAFLAVLGDQTSGRNIEAPESAIRDIVREELERMPPTNVNIRFDGALSELAHLLKPVIEQESLRVGRSMVQGG